MADKVQPIDVPRLALNHCSVEEHAEALIKVRRLPFWWYQGTSRLFGNYSIPFRDAHGIWWYQVKPGFCWPVEGLRAIPAGEACPKWSRSYMGYQHILPEEAGANSRLAINCVRSLPDYGVAMLGAKRRNIRKGLRACTIELLASFDEEAVAGCRAAWNDLATRTGWKHALDERSFAESWRMLLDVPGVSVLVGREAESGEVAGFLVAKTVGDTTYLDTIASRSAMLRTNVNDALVYCWLENAKTLPGVDKAHYGIRSNVASLEKFKWSLGFEPYPFPALLHLRPGVRPLLAAVAREKYRRILGQFDEGTTG